MARALRIEFPGAYYHVMGRGNAQQRIFLDDIDRGEFLRLLALAARRYAFAYHAYALMPNHYHILLETAEGGLSRGLQLINGVYSQFFNYRYDRVGHVFQGRFKALLIDGNAYWLAVSRYIHQNPVKAGLVEKPWDYPWSSCRELLGLVEPASWLKTDQTLGYLVGSADPRLDYRRFLEACTQDDPWEDSVGQSFFGSKEFVHRMRQKSSGTVLQNNDFAYRDELIERPTPETVLDAVGRHLAGHASSRGPGWKNSVEKMTAIHMLREAAGLKIVEIAARFGMNAGAVTQALKRFRPIIANDPGLAQILSILERDLKLAASTQGPQPAGTAEFVRC